jgi:hypothetical protein
VNAVWFRQAARCLFACVALLGALGCHHARPAVAAKRHHDGVCFMPRDKASFAQALRPHDWVKLLVQLELGPGGVYAPRDCTGQPIRWQPHSTEMCPGDETDTEAPALSPMSQDAVVERSLGGGNYLLWIISHRFPNGDGFGPLALVKRVEDGMEVHAIGSLRMRRERVNLELWNIQKEAVVVASGESCMRDGNEGCQRAARLLVHRDAELVDSPMIDPSGRCVQDASVEMARQHEQTLPNGLRRSFALTSAISHDSRFVIIEERLVVRDVDPSSTNLPPREVQHVEANRFITVQNGHLFSKQHPLWERALSQANQ